MSEWKLKECCLSISDGDHLPPPKANSGIPFITISNFVNRPYGGGSKLPALRCLICICGLFAQKLVRLGQDPSGLREREHTQCFLKRQQVHPGNFLRLRDRRLVGKFRQEVHHLFHDAIFPGKRVPLLCAKSAHKVDNQPHFFKSSICSCGCKKSW